MTAEKINEVQNEAKGIAILLQQLQAPMTENNIAILSACLGSLKLIGRWMEEEREAADDDGNADAE